MVLEFFVYNYCVYVCLNNVLLEKSLDRDRVVISQSSSFTRGGKGCLKQDIDSVCGLVSI